MWIILCFFLPGLACFLSSSLWLWCTWVTVMCKVTSLPLSSPHKKGYLFHHIFQSYCHHCHCGFYSWSETRYHNQKPHFKSRSVVTLTMTFRSIVLYINWSTQSELWFSIMYDSHELLRSLATIRKPFWVQLLPVMLHLLLINCVNLFSVQSDIVIQWSASSLTCCPEPSVLLLTCMH